MTSNKKLTTAFILAGFTFSAAYSANALEMTEVGNFKIGDGEGYAEMLRYQPKTNSLMVTASKTGTIERLSLQSVNSISKMDALDLSGGDVTAVAVYGNMVAASIKGDAANVSLPPKTGP